MFRNPTQLVVVLGLFLAFQQVSAAERPNFLLILADDLGVETLGSYGGSSYETPRLDRLATEGLRFDHCYSMAVCHPTRVTLLTGRYPFRWDHPTWGTYPAAAESVSLGQQLKDLGYATAVAGKWQLTLLKDDLDHPHRLGFDEYCLFGWHEGPRYFEPLIYQNGQVRQDVRERYGPDVYSDWLVEFMSRHREQPFCAFYSMALCHDVTDDLEAPVPYGPNGRYENYQEMVQSMDRQVGKLLDALDRLELRDNTIVLFTGDNGTPQRMILTAENGKYQRVKVSSMRHGVEVPGGKGKLTDGGTHVPLLVRWPQEVAAGQTSHALVDMSDFLPTLVDLAAGDMANDSFDGRSFAPVLRDPNCSVRNWVFAEHSGRSWVRDQRWKLYSDGTLFDVHQDPDEQSPLDASNLSLEAQQSWQRLRSIQSELNPKE